MIVSSSKMTSEAWVLEQDNPEGEFSCLWARESGVDYDVDHAVVSGTDYWVVTHNVTGPNFELGYCPVGEELPSLRELTVLMPHDDEVRLQGVDCYRDHIVVAYRRGGIGRAAIMDVREGWARLSELNFNEELYTVGAWLRASTRC